MSDFPRESNPYRPGAGAPPPELAGRTAVLSKFKKVLKQAKRHEPLQSVMPVGLRGVGKTVLLNRFARDAQHEGFEVAYLEASGERGKFLPLIAGRVHRVLRAYERTSARGVLDSLKHALGVLKSFTMTIEPDGRPSFSIEIDAEAGAGDSGILSDDLTEVFVALGEAAKDQNSGFFLAIDEIQSVPLPEFRALIMAVHRTTQLNLPIVVSGTGLPSTLERAGNARTYAERAFEFERIGALSRENAALALTLPAERLGVFFTEEALNVLYDETKGYPYFLQLWGYELWERVRSSPITIDDVRSLKPHLVSTLDNSFFRVRYDRLTQAERNYLRAMAELGPGPHGSGDIAKKYGSNVTRSAYLRDALIGKGVIYSPDYGQTEFTVPLFDQFLRRELPYAPAPVAKRKTE